MALTACYGMIALRVSSKGYWRLSTSVMAQLADKGACVLCKRLAALSEVELKTLVI